MTPIATLITLIAFVSRSDAPVELSYQPRAGAVWRYAVEEELQLRLERCTLELGNGPQPGGSLATDCRRSAVRRCVWTDEYEAVEDERVDRLQRSFEHVDARNRHRWDNGCPVASGATLDEAKSTLASKEIVFEWDADLADYHAEAEPSEYVDRAQLDELRVGGDELQVLPVRRVSIGDTWIVSAKLLRDLVHPLGRVHYEPPSDTFADQWLDGDALPKLDGDLRATLVSIEEFDGNELATLHVEGRLEGRTPWTVSREPITVLGYAVASESERSTTISLDLRGEVAWDVAAHHLRSARWNGAVEITEEAQTSNYSGQEWRTTETWRGELAIDATVAP